MFQINAIRSDVIAHAAEQPILSNASFAAFNPKYGSITTAPALYFEKSENVLEMEKAILRHGRNIRLKRLEMSLIGHVGRHAILRLEDE